MDIFSKCRRGTVTTYGLYYFGIFQFVWKFWQRKFGNVKKHVNSPYPGSERKNWEYAGPRPRDHIIEEQEPEVLF
jgi:hypothetical protein